MSKTQNNHPFQSEEVADRFACYDDGARERLLGLRQRFFDIHGHFSDKGTLEEALRWGQPSYFVSNPKRGTTVRLGAGENGAISIFFTCTSGLVERMRQRYGDKLMFIGNRELHLPANGDIDWAAVEHCIAMALVHPREVGDRNSGSAPV